MGYLDSSGLSHFWSKIKTILSGKQDSLTIGDGLSLKNNTIDIIDPVKGVTKAEYDALTDEEKNSGLYVLTDVESQAGESVLDVYSTEETVIGTWIDGKPLYRKVFSFLSPAVEDGSWQVCPNTTILNVETVVELESVIAGEGGPNVIAMPYQDRAILHFSMPDKALRFYFGTHTEFANKPVVAIIKYTKTTDVATIPQANLLTSKVETAETLSVDSQNEASASSATVTFPSVDIISTASSTKFNLRSDTV